MAVLPAPTVRSFSDQVDRASYLMTSMAYPPVGGMRSVMFVLTALTGGAVVPTRIEPRDDLGPNNSFQLLESVTSGNGNLCLSVWTMVTNGRNGFGGTLITLPKTHSSVSVVEFNYAQINGLTVPIVQSKALFSNTVNGLTLDAAPDPEGSVFSATGWSVLTAITPGTGYTQMGTRQNTFTSPNAQLEAERRHSGAAALVPFTFPSTGGVRIFAAVELKDPTPVVPAGPTVKYWNGTSEVAATLSYWDGVNEIPLTIDQITP